MVLLLALTPVQKGFLKVVVQLVRGPATQKIAWRPWRGNPLPLGKIV